MNTKVRTIRAAGAGIANRRSPRGAGLPTAGLALAVLALAGCGGENVDPAAAREKFAVPVEAEAAHKGMLSVGRTYPATLEGEEQANIVAKISERIAGVHARVGENVPAGTLIVTLDKSGASSQYFQAEAAYKNAEKTLERMKSLQAEGAVSVQALDAAQTAYDVAHANFVAARGMVELTTPIGGMVTAVNANLGDLAVPALPLATVAKINRMRAIFNLNESDVTAIAVGQKVRITSEARPDLGAEGTVVQISRSADVRSRSFEVKALFANTPDDWFRPGMFTRASLRVSSGGAVLSVPNAAIRTDGLTSRVFVVKNGRAFQRTVVTGMTDGERTEIVEGVHASDSVATIGIGSLRDSSEVTVVRGTGPR